jgi:hypothetical protein
VLDRIFSYELGGQELATVVGLMTWNLRVARGFELQPPPEVVPDQEARTVVPDARQVPAATLLPEPADVPPPAPAAQPPDQDTAGPPRGVDVVDGASASVDSSPRARLNEALDKLDWPTLLDNRPGWIFRSGKGEMQCPDGQALTLSFVRHGEDGRRRGRSRLFFNGRTGACDGCELRSSCFSSTSPRAAKMINVSVDSVVAHDLEQLLRATPRRNRVSSDTPPPPQPKEPRSVVQRGDLPIQAPSAATPGPFAVQPPLFLPAAARRAFGDAASALAIEVRVDLPAPREAFPSLVAPSVSARRHAKLTWDQHVSRNALPQGARVDVRLAGPTALAFILRGRRGSAREHAG